MQVRKHADRALETLLAHDPSKETMIRELKFRTFNQEWLDWVDQNVDSLNAAPHSPVSPPPHEALMGLYDDDDTAQVRLLTAFPATGCQLHSTSTATPVSAAETAT